MRRNAIVFAISLAISVSSTRCVYANVELSLVELTHVSAVQIGWTITIYVKASGGTPISTETPYRFSRGWTVDPMDNTKAYRPFTSTTVASITPSSCTVYDKNGRQTISFRALYWIELVAYVDKSPNKTFVREGVEITFNIPKDVTIAVPAGSGLKAALEITFGDKVFSKTIYDPVTEAHPVRATSSTMPTSNSAFVGDKKFNVNIYDNTAVQNSNS